MFSAKYDAHKEQSVLVPPGVFCILVTPDSFGEMRKGMTFEIQGKQSQATDNRLASTGNQGVVLKNIEFPTFPKAERWGNAKITCFIKANRFSESQGAKAASTVERQIQSLQNRLDKLKTVHEQVTAVENGEAVTDETRESQAVARELLAERGARTGQSAPAGDASEHGNVVPPSVRR